MWTEIEVWLESKRVVTAKSKEADRIRYRKQRGLSLLLRRLGRGLRGSLRIEIPDLLLLQLT